MDNYRNQILGLSILILGLLSCGQTEEQKDKEDRKLATVFNRSLYLSDLEGMIPPSVSREDSALVINSFTERWVREHILMHEAEINIPQDLNIDRLVRDYRASLIKHNYEQIILELELDSTIATSELMEFYDKNKEQYKLESPIVNCHFIKVSTEAPDNEQLKKWWNSEEANDFVSLLDYCNNYASTHMLEDSAWYHVDDILATIPSGSITTNNLTTRNEITVEDDNFLYLYKRFGIINEGAYAPLAFIKDQASRAILHQRKLKLLEAKKEEMYDRELARNNVKIYTKND